MTDSDLICLDKKYSTTRLVTQEKPFIESHVDDKFQSVLFLSEGEERKGEGGLRVQDYYKQTLKDKPLITIITVVFNGEQYLEQTILSVINQSYDNVEYIIIDGGSTDGTLDIIKQYEGQVDYWVSEKDGGLYDAMNKGIDLARGLWLNFMNAGDKVFHLHLDDLLKNKYTFTNYYYDLVQKRVLRRSLSKLYITRNTPCHQSIIYKRNDIIKYDLNIPIIADFDQMLGIMKSNPTQKGSSLFFYNEAGISNIKKYSKSEMLLYLKRRCDIIYRRLGLFYYVISRVHLIRIMITKYAWSNCKK